MERGKREAETGREHLEHDDFILFQQKKQSVELDIEIAEKREKLNAENGRRTSAKPKPWMSQSTVRATEVSSDLGEICRCPASVTV